MQEGRLFLQEVDEIVCMVMLPRIKVIVIVMAEPKVYRHDS